MAPYRLVAGLLAALAAGCGSTSADDCVIDADCASGVCGADGTCQPGADANPAAPDGGGTQPDASPNSCQPDHDGFVDRDEVPLRAGLAANFRIATDTTVSTAGVSNPNGTRTWDLSGTLEGDRTAAIELTGIDDAWYAETFPSATYSAPLAGEDGLRGVFQVTDGALRLLGVVSPEAGPSRTELTYDPPIDVLAFPVTNGASWGTTSTVTGLAQGVAAGYTERYEQQVDAVGTIDTPYGEFPVVRVRVELTRTVGVTPITSRSYLFVSECFGTVASIVSQDYESEVEFTEAAEVRRLAP